MPPYKIPLTNIKIEVSLAAASDTRSIFAHCAVYITMQSRWPRMDVVTQRSPTNSLKSCLGLTVSSHVRTIGKILKQHIYS